MLREQLLRCQEYECKGEAALGPIVSLLSAIQDEKKAERKTAELVIRAQQETLSRLDSKIFLRFQFLSSSKFKIYICNNFHDLFFFRATQRT